MNDGNRSSTTDCARALERIHRRLDGEALEPAEARGLEAHLAVCSDCREAAQELEQLQAALRALPSPPFPDAALERVWRRTSRRPLAVRPRLGGWLLDWRAAAVATAAAGLALLLWWPGVGPDERSAPPDAARGASSAPTEQELARAAEEVRLVLGMTARALRRTERTAVDEVLAGKVSTALRRTSIRWPGAPARAAQTRGDDDV